MTPKEAKADLVTPEYRHMYKTYILIGLLLLGNMAGWAQKKRAKTPASPVQTEEDRKAYHAKAALVLDAVRERISGNYSQAEKILADLTNQYPSYDLAHFEYAKILLLKNRTSEAINELKTAISLNDTNDWYKALLGESLDKANRYAESESIWKYLADHHPDNPEYIYKYSISLIYQNKFKEAISAYDRIELVMGVSEDISYAKRNIWLHLKKTDMAVKEMEKLSEAYPLESKYQIDIAEIYARQNMNDKAIPHLEKAADLDPENGNVNIALYNHYITKKQPQQAFKYLGNAIADPGTGIDKKIRLLLPYYSDSSFENKDMMLMLLQKLVNTHPDESKAWSIYGDFARKYLLYDTAITAFEHTITLDQSKYDVWHAYMELLFLTRQYGKLVDKSSIAIELFPMQVPSYFFLGMAHLTLQHAPQARAAFNEGKNYIFNKKEKAEFNTLIAQTFCMEDNMDSAAAYYEQALAVLPGQAGVLNDYSYELAIRKMSLPYALQMADKANKLKPDNAAYQDTYAWVLYQMGNYADAKIWMEKAIKNGGDTDAEILQHYIAILEHCENTADLQKYYHNRLEQLKQQ
ncbi:MAG: hypothetical protein J5701_02835 [Bacteroidales bacterium]|nr:hypothetical protein [Bacteroidales bacterium]